VTAATPRDAIAATVPRLAAAGIEDARRDAELLLCLALDCDRAHLIGYPDSAIDVARQECFERLVLRRLAREPMSQIIGVREFWSLDFLVTTATLTPRPESEAMIEAVLADVPDRDAGLRLLDLGTGTGCLLLALLAELPAATGVGVDVCEAALSVARANGERLGLGDRAVFVHGDWAADLDDRFDIVVCNPPYIEAADLANLDPEVAHWEPRLALDGGDDGLHAYRRIVPDLARLLVVDGIAVLEHGPGQADAIELLAVANGLIPSGRHRDLAGRDRCVILTK
jgi:release factor glutamine methyltransferase